MPMTALFDVNVLIALLDADHALHRRAFDWFAAHARLGWATCPITENGCLRVMSNPAYPNARSISEIAGRLAAARDGGVHRFWPDDVSLLDPTLFDPTRIHGPRQLTDVYLLALATRHGGRLVTFDAAIATPAVKAASARNLLAL